MTNLTNYYRLKIIVEDIFSSPPAAKEVLDATLASNDYFVRRPWPYTAYQCSPQNEVESGPLKWLVRLSLHATSLHGYRAVGDPAYVKKLLCSRVSLIGANKMLDLSLKLDYFRCYFIRRWPGVIYQSTRPFPSWFKFHRTMNHKAEDVAQNCHKSGGRTNWKSRIPLRVNNIMSIKNANVACGKSQGKNRRI